MEGEDFSLMDNRLHTFVQLIDAEIGMLSELEEIKGIIMRTSPNELLPMLYDEERLLRKYLTKYRDCTNFSNKHLNAVRQEAYRLLNNKEYQVSMAKNVLITDVVAGYVKNCAKNQFPHIPDDFFSIKEFNFRFRLNRFHQMANWIAKVNHPGFNEFLKNFSDLFDQCTDLYSDSLKEIIDTFEIPRRELPWDMIIAIMMVIAHVICMIIKKRGVTDDVKLGVNSMIADFAWQIVINSDSFDTFEAEKWENITLEKGPTPPAEQIHIQMVLVMFPPGSEALMPEEARENSEENEAAITLQSKKFMGVCEAPVPSLLTLTYNSLPYSEEQKEEFFSHFDLPTFEKVDFIQPIGFTK